MVEVGGIEPPSEGVMQGSPRFVNALIALQKLHLQFVAIRLRSPMTFRTVSVRTFSEAI